MVRGQARGPILSVTVMDMFLDLMESPQRPDIKPDGKYLLQLVFVEMEEDSL